MWSMVFGPRSGGQRILPLSQSPGMSRDGRGGVGEPGANFAMWGAASHNRDLSGPSHTSTLLCRGNPETNGYQLYPRPTFS